MISHSLFSSNGSIIGLEGAYAFPSVPYVRVKRLQQDKPATLNSQPEAISRRYPFITDCVGVLHSELLQGRSSCDVKYTTRKGSWKKEIIKAQLCSFLSIEGNDELLRELAQKDNGVRS